MTNEIQNYESFITWDNGIPIIGYREMLTKEVVADLPLAALSARYERSDLEIELGINESFEGMTLAEVMHIRLARKAANGDMTAIKLLQDRILGKPKQQIESKKLTMTYADYLEEITSKENDEIIEAQVNEL
jgi:hypothetical protein